MKRAIERRLVNMGVNSNLFHIFHQVAEGLKAARALDSAEHRASVLEAESAALRKALNECQSRHAEQMARFVQGPECCLWLSH